MNLLSLSVFLKQAHCGPLLFDMGKKVRQPLGAFHAAASPCLSTLKAELKRNSARWGGENIFFWGGGRMRYR